jgi:hypothetical protein
MRLCGRHNRCCRLDRQSGDDDMLVAPGEGVPVPDLSPRQTQTLKADPVGGLPLVRVEGTPRAMGDLLGDQLAPRLRVMVQDTDDILQSALGNRLKRLLPAIAEDIKKRDPTGHMELESLATTAGLPMDSVIGAHGFASLMGSVHNPSLRCDSSMLAIPRAVSSSDGPLLGLLWRIPAQLSPHLTLVARRPSHGPATITLTIAGLHPIAGLCESGFAIAVNDLHMQSLQQEGLPPTAMVNLALSCPTYEDAHYLIDSRQLLGNAAFTLIDRSDRRATMETADGICYHLPDPDGTSPRVHTNHPLHRELQDSRPRAGSLDRLQNLARAIHLCDSINPRQMAECMASQARDSGSDHHEDLVTGGILVIDPRAAEIQACAGSRTERLTALPLLR